MEIRFDLLILGFHLLFCLITYLFIRKKVAIPAYYLLFSCGLPVIGSLMLWITVGTRQSDSDKLDIIEEASEEKTADNRDIIPNDEKENNNLISLEEALLLKNSDVARDILLDIIGENPEDFLDLFYLARLNEDAEVVHYATTVIAELSRQYDLKINQLEKTYAKNPDDLEVLTKYCTVLENYLNNEFVTGQMAQARREELVELLEKKIQLKENLADFASLADNLLILKQYKPVQTCIDYMMRKWPEDENPWLLQLRLFLDMRQGHNAAVLARKMKEESIYISADNRALVDFWQTV